MEQTRPGSWSTSGPTPGTLVVASATLLTTGHRMPWRRFSGEFLNAPSSPSFGFGVAVVTVTDASTGPTWTPMPTVSAWAIGMDTTARAELATAATTARRRFFVSMALTPLAAVRTALVPGW